MEMSREYWAQAERGQRFLRMRVGDGGEGAQALWLPVALTSSCREGGGGSDTLPAAQQPWLAEVVASEAAAAAATAAAATATATATATAAAAKRSGRRSTNGKSDTLHSTWNNRNGA